MEHQLLVWIVSGLGASLSLIAVWAWNHTHKRIDDAWEALDEKAPNEELTRVRNTQVEIFTQLREHDKQDQQRHTEIITSVARLEGKLDTLLTRRRGSDDSRST